MVDSSGPNDPSTPAPRRRLNARQVERRDEVLVAAADAFTSRGYAATSIDDIADRLGATKGRVYHYFRTKGEIFIGIHKRALELAFASLEGIVDNGEPAVNRLYRMAEAHAMLMMTGANFMRLAARHTDMGLASEGRTRQEDIDEILKLRHEYEAQFEHVIADGMAAGEFQAKDSFLMAKAVLGALNWMSMWYNPRADDTEAQKRRIAQSMAEFVTHGLKPTVEPNPKAPSKHTGTKNSRTKNSQSRNTQTKNSEPGKTRARSTRAASTGAKAD
ncbi:TetR/AcrR family transcriptional regulator [Mycolicibacterium thermoresistibile]